MGKVLAVINQKGGVGKTTTVINLGAALYLKNLKVLLVDMDAQCNLSYSAGGEYDNDCTVLEFLTRQRSAADCIQHLEKFDLIGGSADMAGLSGMLTENGREYRLREVLAPLKGQYDFIIIDSPPALSLVTVSALTAADSFIITAQTDVFSMQGIGQLYGTYETVKNYSNPDICIDGILLTRAFDRFLFSRRSSGEMEEMAAEMGTRVFRNMIHESVKVREAAAQKKDLFAYAPKSRPAEDYMAFTDEYLKMIGEKR